MSGAITFGATITGGIQDVAGILPLLGTEQCEEHIGSALTKGYLYAAAAPMSIFGSLGVARSGFKTLIACMSGQTWSGARILANMGFEPKGINLSLVMIDKNDKDGRHLAETRLDELVKELHIDPSRATVSHKCTRWNVTIILLTAFLSSLSMIPYIHLNHRGNNLTHFSQWTFPILRAAGGFLTASMMQIVLERRIDKLATNHLAKFNRSQTAGPDSESPGEIPSNTGNTGHPPSVNAAQGSQGEARPEANSRHAGHNSGPGDVEKGLGVLDAPDPASDSRPVDGKLGGSFSSQDDHANDRTGILDWVLLILLLAGIVSSVVGYVGCFSVVQNAKLHTGPLSWLCLEAGLSILRMILWGLNPKGNDAPPLELVLRLDHDTILPTCNSDNARILREKVLPLTRAKKFLDSITSFAGLVERFTHPDLTLYYTLTRECLVYNKRTPGWERSEVAGKRVLYITLFDHKERTTRVYTRDDDNERFYSTESDVPLIDLRHGLLETKLEKEMINKDDMIAGDLEILPLLRTHHQSIIDQIHFTIGKTISTSPGLPHAYTIENKWTMKAADVVAAREKSRCEDTATEESARGRLWEPTVERGRLMEVNGSSPTFERDHLYFEFGRLEEMRRSHDTDRGRWIDSYMMSAARKTRETTATRRVDGEPAGNERVVVENKGLGSDGELKGVNEEVLILERFLMEKLLVYEAEAWEGLLWNRVKEFMGRNNVPESVKEQLKKEWRGNCWKRLDDNIRAADTRMELAMGQIDISALDDYFVTGSTLKQMFKDGRIAIRGLWQSVIERLVDSSTPSVSSSNWSDFNKALQRNSERIEDLECWDMITPWERLKEMYRQRQAMARRLKKELEGAEIRIAQGLNLPPIGNSSSHPSFMPNAPNTLVLQASSSQCVPQDVQLLDEGGNPYRQPFNVLSTAFHTHSMADNHESWDSESGSLRDGCESRDEEPRRESSE